MKSGLKIAALLLALGQGLPAEQTIYQTSLSAGRWLNLPYSTRAAALAGLGTTGSGVDAMSYNPAGLATTPLLEANLAQNFWLTDASSQRLGFAMPMGVGGLGIAFDNVNYGSISQYSVDNLGQIEALGSVNPDAWALQAGYGWTWDGVGLGAAVQGLDQDLGGQVSAGASLDLGATYQIDDVAVGVALLQTAGFLGSEGLPMNLDIGGDWLAWSRGQTQLDLLGGIRWQVSDSQETAALGVEAHLTPILALRAGYRAANSLGVGGWATGLGVTPLPWIGLDYAYNAVGSLQATNQVALNVYWSGWHTASPEPTPAAATPSPTPSPKPKPKPPTPSPTPSPTPAPPTPTPTPIRTATPVAHSVIYHLVAIAGTGTSGFSGDGASGLLAQLNGPLGVAVGAKGDVYVADEDNHRIRRVDAAGNISTFAGKKGAGYSGDGAAATGARLNYPAGLALDGAGDLYIADSGNNRIRVVSPSGVIGTFAGNGVAGRAGDGGPAAGAELSNPVGIASDGIGNLYIADTGNNRICKVDASGRISSYAGTGVAGFAGDGGMAAAAQLSYPTSVAVDDLGDLYIADTGNNRIRRVDAAGRIATVAGTDASGFSGDGAQAALADLKYPTGVAVDASGDVFISDSGNHRIRRVDALGVIRTVAGNGSAGFSEGGTFGTAEPMDHPAGLACGPEGSLFVADYGNQSVRALK